MRRLSVLFGFFVFCLLSAGATKAWAYAQFQFITGTYRCNSCHFNPAGGGLINSWGREEAGDTISLGGDGSFLHGLWEPPDRLALGGDFRMAFMVNDTEATGGREFAQFPMQAEIYVRYSLTEGDELSVYGAFGFRGQVREEATFANRFISREHFLMWRPAAVGPYARAGRFFAPFGLRLVEHITFIRERTGFNLFQETYGISGGYVGSDWELHVTGFVPDFTGQTTGEQGRGVAAYFERRVAQPLALGLQTRFAIGDNMNTYTGGAVAKYYWEGPEILFLGELNLIGMTFPETVSYTQAQLVGYGGITWLPTRGLYLTALFEHFDSNLARSTDARNAAGFQIQFFPQAHVELSVFGRTQVIGMTEGGQTARLLLAQFHYYL